MLRNIAQGFGSQIILGAATKLKKMAWSQTSEDILVTLLYKHRVAYPSWFEPHFIFVFWIFGRLRVISFSPYWCSNGPAFCFIHRTTNNTLPVCEKKNHWRTAVRPDSVRSCTLKFQSVDIVEDRPCNESAVVKTLQRTMCNFCEVICCRL